MSYEWIKVSNDKLKFIEKEDETVKESSEESGWCH